MSKTDRFLRFDEVCAMVGVSRSTINRWRDEGTFPPPVVVRHRPDGKAATIRWRLDDILNWMATKT